MISVNVEIESLRDDSALISSSLGLLVYCFELPHLDFMYLLLQLNYEYFPNLLGSSVFTLSSLKNLEI